MFPPLPCYLVPPMPKHSPQHPINTHSQRVFLPQCKRQISHPHKTTRNIIFLYDFIFIALQGTAAIQTILHWMTASVAWLQSAVNFLMNLNISTLSNQIVSILILWLRPVSWYRELTKYLVLLAFTYCPNCALKINQTFVFSLQ